MSPSPSPAAAVAVSWMHEGVQHQARWRSEALLPAPQRIELVDDRLTADRALHLASEGVGLLWRGDFHNARQLLQALSRRLQARSRRARARPPGGQDAAPVGMNPASRAQEAGLDFYRHRQAQGQRARVLSMLVIELDGARHIDLPRAPDLRAACNQAWGPADGQPELVSLRELQGVVGAFEWRRRGVEVPLIGRIHPHYGVFSPVRGEYLDLVVSAPLPQGLEVAFDIGTGTGVLAALLARRGVPRVVATDQSERALACARDNLGRLGLTGQVQLARADLFPTGRAQLVVCNPPWLPGRAASPLEAAVYDPDSRMLRGFVAGLGAHLAAGGEGWLVLSDLAEHLGLRTREALQAWFDQAGLRVIGRIDIRPRHPKALDADDPLASARRREITSLWRLAPTVSAGTDPAAMAESTRPGHAPTD